MGKRASVPNRKHTGGFKLEAARRAESIGGNQSVVSQALSGKRLLNARQIAALARRFKVSADAFIGETRSAA